MAGPNYAVRYPDLHGEGGAAFLAGTGHGGGIRRDAFLEAAWTFDRIQAEVLAELYHEPPGPKFGPAQVVYVTTIMPSGRREIKPVAPLRPGDREWVRHLVGQELAKGAAKAGPPSPKASPEGKERR